MPYETEKPHHFEARRGDRLLQRCRAAGVEPALGLAADLLPLNKGVLLLVGETAGGRVFWVERAGMALDPRISPTEVYYDPAAFRASLGLKRPPMALDRFAIRELWFEEDPRWLGGSFRSYWANQGPATILGRVGCGAARISAGRGRITGMPRYCGNRQRLERPRRRRTSVWESIARTRPTRAGLPRPLRSGRCPQGHSSMSGWRRWTPRGRLLRRPRLPPTRCAFRPRAVTIARTGPPPAQSAFGGPAPSPSPH